MLMRSHFMALTSSSLSFYAVIWR